MARVLHLDECVFTAAIIFQYGIIANCDFLNVNPANQQYCAEIPPFGSSYCVFTN